MAAYQVSVLNFESIFVFQFLLKSFEPKKSKDTFCEEEEKRLEFDGSKDGGDPQEVGHRRRRRVRKDLPLDRLQQGPVPRSVRAHRLRELRRRHRS